MMTLLIVEDNAGIRRMLRLAVASIATKVSECHDGADALAEYTAVLPDVVLMDIRMPRLDGLSATRLIRQHHPTARIVVVTDYDDDELRLAARQAGACGYALKQNLTGLAALIGNAAAA